MYFSGRTGPDRGVIQRKNLKVGCGLKEVNSARCWCTRPEVAPNFKESGQFMITLENNAGMLEYYYNSTHVTLYESGKTEPQYFDGSQPDSNYFHDFVKDVQGLSSPLDTAEVLRTQRELLLIQSSASSN